jgi:hypothetical protein
MNPKITWYWWICSWEGFYTNILRARWDRTDSYISRVVKLSCINSQLSQFVENELINICQLFTELLCYFCSILVEVIPEDVLMLWVKFSACSFTVRPSVGPSAHTTTFQYSRSFPRNTSKPRVFLCFSYIPCATIIHDECIQSILCYVRTIAPSPESVRLMLDVTIIHDEYIQSILCDAHYSTKSRECLLNAGYHHNPRWMYSQFCVMCAL